MKKILYVTLALCLLLTSCGTPKYTRSSQYAKMFEEKPVTLLIMPPINNSSTVEAKELLYTSISRPLAEAGYYVISPLMAMDILKAESAYDAELFVEAPLDKFAKYFGADAVVFSEIKTWTKSVIGSGISTNIRYFIRSTKTGDIIFDRTCNLFLDLAYTTNSNEGWAGLLVNLAASVIKTAVTEPIEAARAANYYIFQDIPYGKFHPEYQMDMDYEAAEKDISTTVKR